jgi:ribosomal protein L11 methyltransferase
MLELSINLNSFNQNAEDIIVAKLYELNFESFWLQNLKIVAYIDDNKYEQSFITEELQKLQNELNIKFSYTIKPIENKNWNEQWEKTATPVVIDNTVIIRPPLLENTHNYLYEILIQPKMAFGTGHHPTTQLIMRYLLKKDLRNKTVVDAGCGTAILSILLEKLGAKNIIAFDIDENAVENAKENIQINNCKKINLLKGSIKDINIAEIDLLIANINRNVLLDELQFYYNCLVKNGELILSGFLQTDVEILKLKAKQIGFCFVNSFCQNEWCCLVFNKII